MRGDRLKQVRERAGHTQESLAELLGRDIKQIWRWEAEKVVPSSDAIVELCKALNVSADYLLGLTDNPIPNREPISITDPEWGLISAIRKNDLPITINIVMNLYKKNEKLDSSQDDQPQDES